MPLPPRPSISLRRLIYAELDTLARERGVTVAGLVDMLITAELGRAGVVVPAYKPQARRDLSPVKSEPVDDVAFGGYTEF